MKTTKIDTLYKTRYSTICYSCDDSHLLLRRKLQVTSLNTVFIKRNMNPYEYIGNTNNFNSKFPAACVVAASNYLPTVTHNRYDMFWDRTLNDYIDYFSKSSWDALNIKLKLFQIQKYCNTYSFRNYHVPFKTSSFLPVRSAWIRFYCYWLVYQEELPVYLLAAKLCPKLLTDWFIFCGLRE